MLRFEPQKSPTPREPRWPDFRPKEPTTPFSERPPLRQLAVVVDSDVLAPASEDLGSPLSLLAGLLTHPYIIRMLYADEGPPGDARRETRPHVGETVPEWLVVGDLEEGWRRPVVFAHGDDVVWTAIMGNGVDVAEGDVDSPAYSELAAEEARQRRKADAIAVQAAGSADADIFITRRRYLHEVTWDLCDGVLIADPDEALPLISLYLRSQGAYITYRSLDGRGTWKMNRGHFFWVGTRELLPAGWRWFTACVQHGANDDPFIYLGQSLLRRIQRALQARDDAHRALNQPQNNATAADALVGLDLVLLDLMGAVDVSARVAHQALALGGSEKHAAWQRNDWLTRVRAVAPGLAAVIRPGTGNAAVLTILSLLRNSIHGAEPDALGLSTSRRRYATLVGLPHADAVRVVAAMDQLGGRESWGVQELLPERIHADPGLLLDRILIETIGLLNELMELTPVERLEGVALLPEHLGPPSEGGFEEPNRLSIRWQLGL